MSPKLKGEAWQPKSETVTRDTRTIYVSQVISMQSKGGIKLLGEAPCRKARAGGE